RAAGARHGPRRGDPGGQPDALPADPDDDGDAGGGDGADGAGPGAGRRGAGGDGEGDPGRADTVAVADAALDAGVLLAVGRPPPLVAAGASPGFPGLVDCRR